MDKNRVSCGSHGPDLWVDEVMLGDTVSVVHGVRPPHHEVGAEWAVGAAGAETTAGSGGPESIS